MTKTAVKQISPESPLYKAISEITTIIEKYTDHIDLLDVIDIVDNLRVLADIAEGNSQSSVAVA
ncbi:MAG: hypothetical protein M1130_07010 [Actinobacteria bacterium]|nr:hypothetical protein [Actinomycetota bacterium]